MTQSFNNDYDTDRVINRLIDWGLQREADNAPRRQYLGASLLGDDCDRRIQYRYQGVQRDPNPINQSETQRSKSLAIRLIIRRCGNAKQWVQANGANSLNTACITPTRTTWRKYNCTWPTWD